MDYKILVKVIVPEIEKAYEVYIPINRTVKQVYTLINKMIIEDTSDLFPMKEKVILCNRFTSEIYCPDYYIRDTNIRNGSQIVFI